MVAIIVAIIASRNEWIPPGHTNIIFKICNLKCTVFGLLHRNKIFLIHGMRGNNKAVLTGYISEEENK